MEIKDVEKLAELARIELSLEEKQEILKDMDSILEYVKQIEEIKLEDINTTYDLKNVWREDLPISKNEDFSKEIITNQFPDSQDGFVKVKKIL